MTDDPPAAPPAKLIDDGTVRPTYVDWFLSAGQAEGIVNLSLGTYDPTLTLEDGVPHARAYATAKLRMSIPFARRFHDVLGAILEQAERESGDEKIADQPVSPNHDPEPPNA
ncbi:hypothetical protein LO749_16805 [Paracoccus denitrificans]|uniref:hypothetical protein n=1 Tax=Paracoccus denitrificans TaxID=266 RepID=UPI001E4C76E2|nr:hypothetical protein [Paracoccus denitrificans]UFS67751.1 hypothetical protein LO749_16805 [Paracoccus denitrificans]